MPKKPYHPGPPPKFDRKGNKSHNYKYDTRTRTYGMKPEAEAPDCKLKNYKYIDVSSLDLAGIEAFIKSCGDIPKNIAKIQKFPDGSTIVGLIKGSELDYLGGSKPILVRNEDGTYDAWVRERFEKCM